MQTSDNFWSGFIFAGSFLMIKNKLKHIVFIFDFLLFWNCFGQTTETSTTQILIYDILTKIQNEHEISAESPRAINVIENIFLSFDEMFPDLKNNFRISHSQNQQLKNIIDIIIQTIYALPQSSDNSGFCAALPSNASIYQRQLGVSTVEIASKIYQSCKDRGAVRSTQGTQIFEKKFVFVKIENDSFLLSGWSNNINTSYLFIKPKTTLGDLVLAIVHEMYISQDPKLFETSISMNLRFLRKNSGSCSSITDEECSFEFDSHSESHQLLLKADLPEVAFTFATMRGNEMERRVLNEILNLENPIERPELKIEFSKIFDQLPATIKQSQQVSLFNQNSLLIRAAKKRYLNEGLEEIKKYFVDFSHNFILPDGSETDFMLYMATPEFSLYSFEKTTATGPGCTYCGGSYTPEVKQKWEQRWSEITNGVAK
jgi:hypothetical protein